MQLYPYIIGLIFLIFFGVIDIKTFRERKKNIPSITTDLFLLVSLLVNGASSMYIGVIAYFTCILLSNFDIFTMKSEVKVYVATSMYFIGIYDYFIYILLILGMSILVKSFIYLYAREWEGRFPMMAMFLVPFAVLQLLL